MNKFSYYLKLMRLHQPTGILLLLFPCLWGIGFATTTLDQEFVRLVLIFTAGAILMRSAGCVINDIIDRDIDKKVARTKSRPLASGAVSLIEAFAILFVLLSISLCLLLMLNKASIIIALLSSILVVTYPFMKRITFWPQAFLGLTFNIGALVGYAAAKGSVEPAALMLYLAGIFWTLGYDTIYAHQDKKDDIEAGVKSTALWLGNRTKPYLFYFYSLTIIFIFIAAYMLSFHAAFYAGLLVGAGLLFWQAYNVNINNPADCMKKFKANSLFGAIIFLSLVLERLNIL